MVKHQVHDEFKSFRGSSLIELSKAVSDFAAQQQVAIKSLAVVIPVQTGTLPAPIIASVGYRSDEASYPINIDGTSLPVSGDLDSNIMDAAERMAGDVICHSLYVNHYGALEVAFLLHE